MLRESKFGKEMTRTKMATNLMLKVLAKRNLIHLKRKRETKETTKIMRKRER